MTADPPPKVSVVVPNFNHAPYLRKRIDSILGQTHQDFELILLDDCSTDDSRDVLSAYAADPRVRTLFNQTNSGSPFVQWNRGVGLARGEYVWIAESDDYAAPQLLARLVEMLDARPGVTVAYCRSHRVMGVEQTQAFADDYLENLAPGRWTADFVADGVAECEQHMLLVNTIANASAVVFRRSAYQQAGGADETFRLNGDWKLWSAMMLAGRVAYTAEPLNYYRFHPSSVRSRSIVTGLNVEESLRVLLFLFDRIPVSAKRRAAVRRFHSHLWMSSLTSTEVPAGRKWKILRLARAFDPWAVPRFAFWILRRIVRRARELTGLVRARK
jgi:glycosyltransferase involved in cell wall biosynthesis